MRRSPSPSIERTRERWSPSFVMALSGSSQSQPYSFSKKREKSIMVRSSRALGILLAAVGVFAAFGESRPIFAFGKGPTVTLADDPPVSGVFKGNGQEAKLAYVSTVKGETFAKPTIIIAFTATDHSEAKN